jgi:hypothetical protein
MSTQDEFQQVPAFAQEFFLALAPTDTVTTIDDTIAVGVRRSSGAADNMDCGLDLDSADTQDIPAGSNPHDWNPSLDQGAKYFPKDVATPRFDARQASHRLEEQSVPRVGSSKTKQTNAKREGKQAKAKPDGKGPSKFKQINLEDLHRPQYDTPHQFYAMQANELSDFLFTKMSNGTLTVEGKRQLLVRLLGPSAVVAATFGDTIKANIPLLIDFLLKSFDEVMAYKKLFSEGNKHQANVCWRSWGTALKVLTLITGKMSIAYLKHGIGAQQVTPPGARLALKAANVLKQAQRRWGQTCNQQKNRLKEFLQDLRSKLQGLSPENARGQLKRLEAAKLVFPFEIDCSFIQA